MKPRKPLRTRQIAAVHACARKLNLDDDMYRARLLRHGGADSCSKLSAAGLARVLDEFQRLVADASKLMDNAVPPATPAPNVQGDHQAMIGKVGAILSEAGLSWEYAQGMARRMFKRERLEWLTHAELHKLVAALSYDQKRRRARAAQGAR